MGETEAAKPDDKDTIYIDFEGEGVKAISIKALTTKTKKPIAVALSSSGKIKQK